MAERASDRNKKRSTAKKAASGRSARKDSSSGRVAARKVSEKKVASGRVLSQKQRARKDAERAKKDAATRQVTSTNRGSRQRSFRLSLDTLTLLDERAQEHGETGNSLAAQLLEEGLRTHNHPLIYFRQGGTFGRRPALVGTRLYVWQVIATVRESESVEDAADYLGLTRAQVQACVSYYADFKDEVDHYAEEEREFARREQDRWRREQEVLG